METDFSQKAAQYKRYIQTVRGMLSSQDPKDLALVREANEGILRTKFLTPGQVHVDSTLSNISIQYVNEEYIGEQLMPVVTVNHLSNIFFKYDKRNRLAAPDDYVGSRASANEVTETRSQDNYSCKPYALRNYIDALTLANQDAPLNEMVDLTVAVADLIAFRREKRIASVMCDSANYSGNTTALAKADRWDNGGNPIPYLQSARAALWSGRGPGRVVGFCSYNVWNALSRNAYILDLFKYGGSNPGLATPQMICKFFDLDDILVGKAREDTANEKQSASYSRIWTDVFGLARVATSPSIRNASFGYTFRFGAVQTDQWFDLSVGTRGGYYARVSTHEDHKVVAGDTGYLITTPIG